MILRIIAMTVLAGLVMAVSYMEGYYRGMQRMYGESRRLLEEIQKEVDEAMEAIRGQKRERGLKDGKDD